MKKAIIFSNDIFIIKNILNNLNLQFIFNVATDLNELINKKTDIIFLDSQTDLKLKNIILNNYKQYTILIGKNDFINNSASPIIFNTIFEVLQKSQNPRQKIINKLQNLGYSFKLRGSYYLVDVILECLNSEIEVKSDLEKKIYPLVAKKYNKSTSSIKSSIYIATKSMYNINNLNTIKQFFHSNKKPTNKEVILAIINSL